MKNKLKEVAAMEFGNHGTASFNFDGGVQFNVTIEMGATPPQLATRLRELAQGIDGRVAPIRTEIDRECVKPARKRDILKWLLTGGRRGSLWDYDRENLWQWSSPPQHINCRSSMGPGEFDKQYGQNPKPESDQ